MTDFRYKVQEIQKLEENKYCIDCGSPNPQWASVSFGTFFCLECSGKQRSLGVHISFVRSVTMDSWKKDQAKKMELGGNARCKEFFMKYNIADLPFKEKYNTKAAAIYKEKLAAMVENRPYECPPPSAELSKPPTFETVSTSSSSPSQGLNQKQKNEDYFARKGMENANRPDDLPPSQGGKYAGFGSDYTPPTQPDLLQDTFSTLSKGFSFFSQKATEVAKIAAEQATVLGKELNENVIKPTAQKIQDPNLRQNISQSLNDFSKKIVETGDKGFNYISQSISGQPSNRQPSSNQEQDWQYKEEEWHNLPDTNSPLTAEPQKTTTPTVVAEKASEKKMDFDNDDWQNF